MEEEKAPRMVRALTTDLDVLGMACCCWDLLGIAERYPELDEKAPMSEMVEGGATCAALPMLFSLEGASAGPVFSHTGAT